MKTPINQQDVSSEPVINMESAMMDTLTPNVPDAPKGSPAPVAQPAASPPPKEEVSRDAPPPPSQPTNAPSPNSDPFADEPEDPFEGEDENLLPPPEYEYHKNDLELMGAIRDYYKLPKAVSDEDAFNRMVTDRRWANNGIWNPFFRSAADDLHEAMTGSNDKKKNLAILIDRFERMDLNGWESFLGNIGPALFQPENVLSFGVGKVAGIGAKTAAQAVVRGLLSGAVVDGAANGLHNHKQQLAQIDLKLRKHYSAKEVAAMGAIGAGVSVLPGATFAAIGAYRSQKSWARKVGALARKDDPAVVSDVSKEVHEAGEALFGPDSKTDEDTWFARLQRGLAVNKSENKRRARLAAEEGVSAPEGFSSLGLIRDKVLQAGFDKLLPIKRAIESSGQAGEAGTASRIFNATYALFRLLPRVGQLVESALTVGVPRRQLGGGVGRKGDKELYTDAEGNTHSLFGTLAPLGEDINVYLQYTAAKRLVTHPTLQKDFVNADEMTKKHLRTIITEGDEKMGHFTDWEALAEGRWDEVTSVAEESDHLWAQTHRNMKEFQRGLLGFVRDSDVIGNAELEDILNSNEFYAPFYKDLSTEEFEAALGSNAISTSGNIRPVGETWADGLETIRSLDRNMIDNTQRLLAAAERNFAYSNLYKEFKDGSLKDVAELWGFKEVGKDHPKAISARVRTTVKDAEGVETERSKSVHFVFEDSIQAAAMMRALDNTGALLELRNSPLMKMFGTVPKRVLVAGVTLEPTYVVRNLIRDAITAGMFTENSSLQMLPAAAQVAGTLKYVTESTSRHVQEATMNGVGMGSMRQVSNARTLTEQAKKYYRNLGANPDNLEPSPMSALANMADKYYVKHINHLENASRIQEYTKTLKRTESKTEAALAAANVSTDFTMRGSSASMAFFNEIFPFFNAALQGIYVSLRKTDFTSDVTRKKALERLTIGFGMLGGASMALESYNSDIDVIANAPSVLKDTHWLWPIDKDGVPTRDNEKAVDYGMLSKPYDVGMFANLMEYVYRVGKIDPATGINYEANDVVDLGKNFSQYLQSVVLLDPSSPVWNALVEAKKENPTTWTGDKVIPPSLEGEEDIFQYKPTTPELYRQGGALLNTSPLKLQFMAESLLGSAMREVAKGMDHIPGFREDGLGKRVPNREWTLSQLPVVRAFVRPGRPVPKAVNEFYALQNEINKTEKAFKASRSGGNQMDMDVYLSHHPDFTAAMEAIPQAKAMLRTIVRKNKEYKRLLDSQTTPEGVTEVMDKVRSGIHTEIVTTMGLLKKSEIIRQMIRRGEKD